MKLFDLDVELDRRTAWLLTGGACAAWALLGVLRNMYNRRQANAKIRRARARRDESLARAEEAVLQYKESVRAALLYEMNSTLLSDPDLTAFYFTSGYFSCKDQLSQTLVIIILMSSVPCLLMP